MIAYTNARIFTGEDFLQEQTLLVQDHKIAGFVPNDYIPDGTEVVDIQGNMLVPAFVDIQTYGGSKGFFVKDLNEESLQNIVISHRKGGTTNLLPTLNSTTFNRMLRAVEVTKNYISSGQKGILGLHIEGPYINPVKRGAHVAAVIRVPTEEELETLIQETNGLLAVLTIAPETWPKKLLNRLMDSDIVVSVGHTNATFKELTAFFDEYGSTKKILVTHLFNAMRPFESREPGGVGAIFDHPNVQASIIADGYHCDFAAIRIAKNQLQNRLFYISDAVGVHCEINRYELDDFNANFVGDHFVNDAGVLAGSAITQHGSLLNSVKKVGISLEESLRMVSTYPAQNIGLGHRLGRIEAGFDAEMVVLDNDLNIVKVL